MIAESDIGKTCVRIPRPRRKYDNFIRLLGHKPQIYYAFHFDGNFAFLDSDELERVMMNQKRLERNQKTREANKRKLAANAKRKRPVRRTMVMTPGFGSEKDEQDYLNSDITRYYANNR